MKQEEQSFRRKEDRLPSLTVTDFLPFHWKSLFFLLEGFEDETKKMMRAFTRMLFTLMKDSTTQNLKKMMAKMMKSRKSTTVRHSNERTVCVWRSDASRSEKKLGSQVVQMK